MNQLEHETSRIIEMAWEDRTPFEIIESQFGLDEKATIKRLALENLSLLKFDHSLTRIGIRTNRVIRGYCPTQYKNR
ncbi:hypothetical protein CJF42_09705 [Pseudoalteromonas sp. NBT06-2]|uniref:DUF2805 domain-containing protein n=1 Tax=Pseudoalteromonas sp. NBT06-2 TaxID=2025950 RepID=UPI000BA5F56D|nr:DUF2805 domain-containing protein [Pseudoalteromonas sp. NBT06-2]PAJ74587.1 hypothetical protein CJF42_09705 [Pseudoalteromonas sp. NBT06-2]